MLDTPYHAEHPAECINKSNDFLTCQGLGRFGNPLLQENKPGDRPRITRLTIKASNLASPLSHIASNPHLSSPDRAGLVFCNLSRMCSVPEANVTC